LTSAPKSRQHKDAMQGGVPARREIASPYRQRDQPRGPDRPQWRHFSKAVPARKQGPPFLSGGSAARASGFPLQTGISQEEKSLLPAGSRGFPDAERPDPGVTGILPEWLSMSSQRKGVIPEQRAALAPIGAALALIRAAMAQLRAALALIGAILAPIRATMAQVRAIVAQVRATLAPMRAALAPIGATVAQVRASAAQVRAKAAPIGANAALPSGETRNLSRSGAERWERARSGRLHFSAIRLSYSPTGSALPSLRPNSRS